MRSINWTRVDQVRKRWRRDKEHMPVPVVQPKVVKTSTTVICPQGQMGRVVDHAHGLNVVVDAFGQVIGHFSTADLKQYKLK